MAPCCIILKKTIFLLSGGDDQVVGIFPELLLIEDAEVGDHLRVVRIIHKLVGRLGVFGDNLHTLGVDGDGGNLSAVYLGENAGLHGGGGLLTTFADANLVDDT